MAKFPHRALCLFRGLVTRAGDLLVSSRRGLVGSQHSRRDSSLLISAFLLCFHCVEPELPLSEGGSRTPVPNSSKATPIAKDIRRLWTVTRLTSNTARGKEEKMATLDT